jgi:glycosyltransferase involved in cell wall biosynthesis
MQLKNMQTSMPHGERVHIVGWQPQPLRWMRRAEVLLLPAVYEGMPNVVLEAMASGVPVVAFEVEGLRQLLGIAGQLESDTQIATAGDFSSFIGKVQRLVEDEALRRQCIAQNRVRVEQQFQLQMQLAQYAALYVQASLPLSTREA